MANNYCAAAVEAAIQQSNRAGRKISGRERKMIHLLLRGRVMDNDDLHAAVND